MIGGPEAIGVRATRRRWAGPIARLLPLAASVGLALAGLAVCEYRFGTGDQLQYLVQVVAIEHPEALGQDPYLHAFPALHSFFWQIIAAVSDEANRPAICLAVAVAVGAGAALLLMRLGMLLAGDPRDPPRAGGRPAGADLVAGGATALAFVVPKEQNWFGLVSLADIELTATYAAVPFAIGAMLAWTAGRSVISLAIALATVPVHGQTAAYLLAAWTVAAIWSGRRTPRRLVLPIVVVTGGLAAVARERRGNGVGAGNVGDLERVGREMYPELIDPWTAPWPSWCAVAAILAIGAASALALARSGAGSSAAHGRFRVWAAASLVLPAAGLAMLAAGASEPFLWRLMVGRSFMLPQIASLVLFAVWAVRAMRRGAAGGAIAAASFALIVWWPLPEWPRPAAALALAAVIAAVALDGAVTRTPARRAPRRFVAAGVGGAAILVAAVACQRFAARPHPWLAADEDPVWRAAQLWARAQSEPGATFLTPPHRAGWRIGAHRPTYGELNDGGLLFYAGEEAIAWAARMAELDAGPAMARSHGAGRAYADALGARGARWCAAHGIDYVVTETAHDVDLGPVAWSSPRYVIRRVP